MRNITYKSSNILNLPPLPILSPTALCGDEGNGKAYLRWNPQLEDERVIGWKVIQLSPEKKILTDGFLIRPNKIIDGLANDIEYKFCVAGVLNDGTLTPQSNIVTIIPQNIDTAKIEHLG
jgi:hypothetical protein